MNPEELTMKYMQDLKSIIRTADVMLCFFPVYFYLHNTSSIDFVFWYDLHRLRSYTYRI